MIFADESLQIFMSFPGPAGTPAPSLISDEG